MDRELAPERRAAVRPITTRRPRTTTRTRTRRDAAAFIARLVETCPPGGIVLDAPCGTGQYFAQVAEAGRRVVGIDQSAGMLEQARARGIAVELAAGGPPGARLRRRVRRGHDRRRDGERLPRGLAARAGEPASRRATGRPPVPDRRGDRRGGDRRGVRGPRARGLPAVRGEVIEGDVAGYHYYPGRERVRVARAEGLESSTRRPTRRTAGPIGTSSCGRTETFRAPSPSRSLRDAMPMSWAWDRRSAGLHARHRSCPCDGQRTQPRCVRRVNQRARRRSL